MFPSSLTPKHCLPCPAPCTCFYLEDPAGIQTLSDESPAHMPSFSPELPKVQPFVTLHIPSHSDFQHHCFPSIPLPCRNPGLEWALGPIAGQPLQIPLRNGGPRSHTQATQCSCSLSLSLLPTCPATSPGGACLPHGRHISVGGWVDSQWLSLHLFPSMPPWVVTACNLELWKASQSAAPKRARRDDAPKPPGGGGGGDPHHPRA